MPPRIGMLARRSLPDGRPGAWGALRTCAFASCHDANVGAGRRQRKPHLQGGSAGSGEAGVATAWDNSRCPTPESPMNQETFNLSIRKFLKMVGINSQREIEQAVAKALDDKGIKGTESFPAHVTLEVPGLGINVKFDGEVKLQ